MAYKKEDNTKFLTQRQGEESIPSFLSSSPSEKNKIYSWMDKYEVKHCTNNIHSIASEYMSWVIDQE